MQHQVFQRLATHLAGFDVLDDGRTVVRVDDDLADLILHCHSLFPVLSRLTKAVILSRAAAPPADTPVYPHGLPARFGTNCVL